jgi:hypothetical protein
MGFIRFKRLGISIAAAAMTVGTTLAFAPPASAATDWDHFGCTSYGWARDFCIDVYGSGRRVLFITANTRGSNTWNGYVVATLDAPKGNEVYRKQSPYHAKEMMEEFSPYKNLTKKGKYKACVAGYSIQHGKYHQFAKACQNTPA